MAHLYINAELDLDIGQDIYHDPKNGYKIGQNTGINAVSGVNTKEMQMNDGKSYVMNNGTKSKHITCTHIFTDEQLNNGLINQLDLLFHHMKTNALPIVVYIDDGFGGDGEIVESFIGKINKYEKKYGINGANNVDLGFIEHVEVKNQTATFNTFNKTTTTTNSKSAGAPLYPSYMADLMKCTPVKANKKGVSCVYSLQKMLKYYKKYLNYNLDGLFWTHTEQELKAWQKDIAKVKVTGKWDSASKQWLDKQWKITNSSKTLANQLAALKKPGYMI